MAIHHRRRMFSVFLETVVVVALVGCGAGGTGSTSTQDPAALYTSAAKTVALRLTIEAGETASQLLTQIALTPTPPPFTPTIEPSATPLPPAPTDTPRPPTNTPVVLPCDRASFISDVSETDTSRYAAGANFTKTWRVRNTGSCTWTTGYALVYASGEQMGSPDEQFLEEEVRPGELADISVDLTAPEEAGEYFGFWMFRNASGVLFGVGEGADNSLVVQIIVKQGRATSFDFTSNYCNATWTTPKGTLQCPGWDGDTENGYIVLYTNPILEDGRPMFQPAIITYPNRGPAGSISGRFPAFRVHSGDHFKTSIGCLIDSPACNVTFQLNYSLNGGKTRNLATWQEAYDEKITEIDLDLSVLDGQSVEFIFTVLNNGSSTDDQAFWLHPVIAR